MAEKEQIMARAKQIIAEQVETEVEHPEQIGPDTPLDLEGGVDSLGFIYVLTTLEAEYGSKVPDGVWNDIHTLSELADAILKYRIS